MDLTVYVQLIFLCIVNIIFTFSGIVLNTLVIVSFWKSPQLRKKLCHFMIMVLSCSDLLTVITNNPGLLVFLVFWLKKDYHSLRTSKLYLEIVTVFFGFSVTALLLMSIERYLGAYYPIFHRTSVTKHRLLTPLAILLIVYITLNMISRDNIIIPKALSILIVALVVLPPLIYFNLRLFIISRKVRRRKATSPEKRTTINLKSISTCLLVVGTLVVLCIITGLYIVFNIKTENNEASKARLSIVWGTTIFTMNCTFNSLIFFWRNKVLRTEGIKILKTLKDRLFEC